MFLRGTSNRKAKCGSRKGFEWPTRHLFIFITLHGSSVIFRAKDKTRNTILFVSCFNILPAICWRLYSWRPFFFGLSWIYLEKHCRPTCQQFLRLQVNSRNLRGHTCLCKLHVAFLLKRLDVPGLYDLCHTLIDAFCEMLISRLQ